MTRKGKRPNDDSDLRRQAEASAREEGLGDESAASPSSEEARRLLHELRVHQIQLEAQNEELRRTQAALEAAWARYFDLYDLAPAGYVTLSGRGVILEANLAASALLGMARGTLINQPFSRFILPEDAGIYYLHHKQLVEDRAPRAWQLRMVRQDGTRCWVRIDATAEQEEGETCRVVLSDITEIKVAEAEKDRLEALNRQLQKSESLGRMAGAIAHHFNNQLQVVTGNLEMALLELPERGNVPDFLNGALQASSLASQVSGLMLTYLGQAVTPGEPLDLSEACRRSLPLLQAAMPKGVVMRFDLPCPGPVVRANENQMQQVVSNLVTNAWEACGSLQGTVRLTVTTVAPGDISASHRFPVDWQPRSNAYACLEVADTGCGIAADDIERLFDPFYSTKFSGRGMGLAVVIGVVRAHAGSIVVESKQDSGSVFGVYIPLTADGLPRPVAKVAAPDMQGRGTVLVVDDEDMVRSVAAAMLASFGLAVLTAKNGAEAVEVFRQHAGDIQCVLCDLTMPHMDGWATLMAIRRLAPGVPVILASGYSEAQVMDGAHRERPNAYLHKPYSMAALKEAIASAMEVAGSGVERLGERESRPPE